MEQQTNRPSQILARLDKKAIAALATAVGRVIKKKRLATGRGKKKLWDAKVRGLGSGDPYKYSQDGEVSASEKIALSPANSSLESDSLQNDSDYLLDDDDDVVINFETGDNDNDGAEADEKEEDVPPMREEEEEDGDWVDDGNGWRSWKPGDTPGSGASWIPAGSDEEEELAQLFRRAADYDQDFQKEVNDAATFLSEQELQRRRAEYRDRGQRLQRQLQAARRRVSPAVYESVRKRSPYSPRVTEPEPGNRTKSLKGRKLRFEETDLDEDEDPRPISSRTRHHSSPRYKPPT